MSFHRDDVTVLIPTRDRRELTQGAVQSVLEQTTLPARILVVDDGSTDGTREVLEELARTSSVPLDVVRGSGKGVGAARNTGLEQVRTRLVCFLDSDDELEPEALQAGLESFQATDAMLVFSGRSFPGEPRLLTKPTDGDRYSVSGLLGDESDFNPPWGLASVAALREVGKFAEDLPCAVDYDLLLRLCLAGHSVRCLRAPVYRHRRARGRVTVSSDPVRNFRTRLLILDRIQQHSGSPDDRAIRCRFKLRLCRGLRRRSRLTRHERGELVAHALGVVRLQPRRVRAFANLARSLVRAGRP